MERLFLLLAFDLPQATLMTTVAAARIIAPFPPPAPAIQKMCSAGRRRDSYNL